MKEMKLGSFTADFAYAEKFRLFSFRDVFSKDSYLLLQKAFSEVPWVKKEASFYTQYESFVLPSHKHSLADLYNPSFFIPFKKKLEEQLGVSFQDKLRLAAHKLVTADAIGIHNDYTNPEMGEENFRFIFQFAQEKELLSGGELSFLRSRYTKEIIKEYSYGSNTGVCFEITPYSFHCVAPVEGERHTLVMYLWETGRKSNSFAIDIG